MEVEEVVPDETAATVDEPAGNKKRKLHKYFRTHAHRNPFSDGNYDVPISPDQMNWQPLYPAYFQANTPFELWTHQVVNADIGCGYGGLLVSLAKLYPEKLSLGIEIRPKVVEYVQQRIEKLQEQNAKEEANYKNCAVFNTNAMKFLPNYFFKGQLEKLFFLFPDPHFKKQNHRRRIINSTLLAEYAYVLKVGGKLYTITDVLDLHQWMYKHLAEHPLFELIGDEENAGDDVVPFVQTASEESKKVDRSGGSKYLAVFRRIEFTKY
jgi:tRNA (guanine-N7-)-methyltransferase